MIITNFFAATDLVVIGNNPEMADYDNPRGDIIGYAAYVYADSECGERRRIHMKTSRWESEVLPNATKMAMALNARLAKGLLPIAFETWENARPAYGSEAYVTYEDYRELEF